MSIETVEMIAAELRRGLAGQLGDARAVELAAALQATAEEIATLYAEGMELEDGDPDFTRPLG